MKLSIKLNINFIHIQKIILYPSSNWAFPSIQSIAFSGIASVILGYGCLLLFISIGELVSFLLVFAYLILLARISSPIYHLFWFWASCFRKPDLYSYIIDWYSFYHWNFWWRAVRGYQVLSGEHYYHLKQLNSFFRLILEHFWVNCFMFRV